MKKLFFLSIAFLAAGMTVAQNVSIGHTIPVARLDIRGIAANPSIPGSLSNGILRVGVNEQVGIDIGKMGDYPWSGWIQSGAAGFLPDPLSLQPLGGNVGIGNTNPAYPLDVTGNQPTTGNFTNTGTAEDDTGVTAVTASAPGSGNGVKAIGGAKGVHGEAILPGIGDRFGLYGNGANGVSNFGVYGLANSGTNTYGVYGSAFGAQKNYAGYFDQGNVFIQNNLGIGGESASTKLFVNGNIKVVDGTQGAGKVLTSDATGLASWQSPPPPPPPTPVDYPVVWICCNPWMTKNLDVATYRNGDPIPEVTDPAAWAALTTGAWCYYNNDPSNGATYGKLYNWYAVNDPRGLAPIGWHIASDWEWETLSNCLGGFWGAGGYLKEIGTVHWTTPNEGAENLSNFTALPGGRRDYDGTFWDLGPHGFWWSSTTYNMGYTAWSQYLTYYTVVLTRSYGGYKTGYSVRCLRD